ncbi:MAG: TonB-dependent receptor [Polyangiales bacterium]|nr:TonB-dependent receptor [Myxococcales bacterium]
MADDDPPKGNDPPKRNAAEFSATGRTERPLQGGSDLDPSAAATVIDMRRRVRAEEGLDEVLVESPGAQATALGGVGAYRTLSLRGTDAEHTLVLLGTVPLSPVGGGAFDLSTLPPTLLDRVEVYRGGSPAWLGAGAIGGVLRLMPAEGTGKRARGVVTYGSFGTYGARADASLTEPNAVENATDGGHRSFAVAVGARHSDGDFPYRLDPTPLLPGDETNVRRTNADADEAQGVAHLRLPVGGGSITFVGLGYGRMGGVPGPAVRPTAEAHRTLTRGLAALGWERVSGERDAGPPQLRVAFGGSLSVEQNRFTDRLNEVGLGARATDDTGSRGFVRAATEWNPWRAAGVTGVVTFSHDAYAPSDSLAAPVGASRRETVAGALEARWSPRLGPVPFDVRPSVRFEGAFSRLEEIRAERQGEDRTPNTFAPTYRLAASAGVLPWLTLHASGASAVRVPSMVELFGDRGYLVGDSRLRPETSYTVDGGLTAGGRVGAADGHLEARGFATWTRDLIRYALTSQFQTVPENIARARLLGAELEASGGVRLGGDEGTLRGLVTATWLRAVDVGLDRTLPLRPKLQLYARPEWTGPGVAFIDTVTLYADVTHVGSNFGDAANLVVLQARTRVGVGAVFGMAKGRLDAAFSIRDLGDTRGQDVLGFPLPGRTVFLTLTAKTE